MPVADANAFVEKLDRDLGSDRVQVELAQREFFSTDISGRQGTAAAVVRPQTIEEVHRIVEQCAAAGVAIYPRGGGLSYSGGYHVTRAPAINLDLRGLNRIDAIDSANGCVTVEAGVTWQQLHDALRAQGLRTPFFGPFSGGSATVGGSLSQHAVSLGSARHGCSADSVLSLEVVTGTGERLRSGSAGVADGREFFRHHGPDLTGFLLGDCGVFGIKTRATLRLLPRERHWAFLSFACGDFAALAAGMAAVARLGFAEASFGNDPAALAQMQKAQQSGGADLRALLGKVYRDAGNPVTGAWRIARLAANGQKFLRGVTYSFHVILAGHSWGELRTQRRLIRNAVAGIGRPIANSIPMMLASSPFVPLPPPNLDASRRGVPQHAVVPLTAAEALHNALQALYQRHASAMQQHDVSAEAMFSTIATNAFLYEPIVTWRDSVSEFNRHYFRDRLTGRTAGGEDNPAARELANELRTQTRRIFCELGALNFQLGKSYRYGSRLAPLNRQILLGLKRRLDPQGILNPGALELDPSA